MWIEEDEESKAQIDNRNDMARDIELLTRKREMIQAQQRLEKERMELQRAKIELLKINKQ